jgi:hypothetical protein
MGVVIHSSAVVKAQPCVVPDNGSGTVNLPPPGCGYLSPDDLHVIINGLPAGTTIQVAVQHERFFCKSCVGGTNPGQQCTTDGDCFGGGTCQINNPTCSIPPPQDMCIQNGGTLGGEKECSESQLTMSMQGTGSLSGFSRLIPMRAEFETHVGPRTPGMPVQSFDTEMMRLYGQLPIGDPDFDLLRVTAGRDLGHPMSPGHTTLTRMGGPGAPFVVDSFFDIFYEIEFAAKPCPGGPLCGMSGSTTGTIRMQTNACKVNSTQDGCTGVCHDTGDTCVPKVWGINAGGSQVVLDCGCAGPNDCRVDMNSAIGPTCNPTGCDTPKQACTPVFEDTSVPPDGTADRFECRCIGDSVYENWVVADDFMVGCADCTCDLNRDGLCDQADDFIIHDCQVNPTPPAVCRNADYDCDGDVDWLDDGTWYCLLNNPPDVCCPNPRPRPVINKLRWYGSYLNPAFDPMLTPTPLKPDGWYVAIHSDLPPVSCPPLPAGPGPGGGGKKPIDTCCRLEQGVEQGCLMCRPQGSAFVYNVNPAAVAPYGPGDEIRICGFLDTVTPTTCQQGIATIIVNAVMECETKVSRPDRLIAQWYFPDMLPEPLDKFGECDTHRVYCYNVDMSQGCLLHNYADPAEIPNPNGPFFPQNNRTYWLSIQAEVGATFTKTAPGQCQEIKTGNTVINEFWGWHTTPPGYQQKDDAYMGQVTMGCPPDEWVYEWNGGHLHCSDPRYADCCDDSTKSIDMAFCLFGTRRVCAGTSVSCTVAADCPAGTTCIDIDTTRWCQPVNGGAPQSDAPPPFPRPFPAGAVDELANTNAFLIANIGPPGQTQQVQLQLAGPVVVARSSRVPGLPPGTPVIDTEMIMLDLHAIDGSGAHLRLNPQGQPFGGRSLGAARARPAVEGVCDFGTCIAGNVGAACTVDDDCDLPAGSDVDPWPADSFFDVVIIIELPTYPNPIATQGPIRLTSQIHEAPPTGSSNNPATYVGDGGPGGLPVQLVDQITAQPIGTLKFVQHQIVPREGFDVHSDTNWNMPGSNCCEPDDTSPTLCAQTSCPNPDEECRPTAVILDATGYHAVDCACQAKCRVNATPTSVGCDPLCPDPTEQCTLHGLDSDGDGLDDMFRCICEPAPACAPNSTGTACVQACPVAGQECIPKKVKCEPGQTSCSIVECECKDQNCHVDLTAAGLPYCVSPCPNPAHQCKLRGVDTGGPDGDGEPDLWDCFCDPPADCGPNSLGTECNPITCPDTGTGVVDKCLKKCAILNPLTGQVTLSDCECVGPQDCHLELHTGGAAAGGSPAAGGVAGPGIPPECVVSDDGSGTVTLPPPGCPYLSPDEFHKIVDGLPPGTTIEIAAIHKDFICNRQAGSSFCSFPIPPGVDCDDEEPDDFSDGANECHESTLQLELSEDTGLNTAGPGIFMPTKMMPVMFETHTGPRTPGMPLQSFDTEMVKLQGQLPAGDPDFDLLRIRAGSVYGLPSPGHTTLTRMGGPGSSWAVDSFFDIFYEIEYVGKPCPGSIFCGRSGSTTGTIRMSTKPFKCVGNCPPGMRCNETREAQADGTIKVCCECEPAVCEPLPDQSACNNAPCGCTGTCTSFGGYVDNPNCCLDPENCMSYAENSQEAIKRCGNCFGSCVGGSYCDDPNDPPNCWTGGGGPVCWVDNYHISVYLCGGCFGQCINGSYCDHPNPNCCLDPSNCQCYAPTHPMSIKMCGEGEQCRPHCVKYDQALGQVSVTDCDCIGDQCFVQVGAAVPQTAGPGGPCEVVDNGSGSVDLPPAGCEYLGPDEVHKIIDGLPANTEIHLAPIHKDFICNKQQTHCSFPDPDLDCKEDGGTLGGEMECSSSTLEFELTGTGALAGWNRIVTIPNVLFETHIGKKKPFDPVQSFPTDMRVLQGAIQNPGSGDPDFDLLRITAGTANGLPSPGHTTLTQLPDGRWSVDSFFDIEYRIDFIGRATSPRIGGMSGSTTGTIRMATPTKFKCTNKCPPGQKCVQTATKHGTCASNPALSCTGNTECPPGDTCNLDGTMTVCCDCVDADVCEPKPDKKSCTNNTCPPNALGVVPICKPKRIQCFPPPRGCEVVECDCQDGDPCHPEMPAAGSNVPVCTGGCPIPPDNNKCVRKRTAVPGGGVEYTCRCVQKHPPPIIDTTSPNANRHTPPLGYDTTPLGRVGRHRGGKDGEDGEDGTVAGPVSMQALRILPVELQNPVPTNNNPPGGCCPPPDYTAFDTTLNAVCTAGSESGGYRCTSDLNCTPPSTCGAPQGCTAAGEGNGCARWAGQPANYLEAQDVTAFGVYRASRLQCAPYFTDWAAEGTFVVTGAEVLPSSQYAAQFVDIGCVDLDEDCFSDPAVINTPRWGDVSAPFQGPGPPLTQPNGIDVTNLVNAFRHVTGAPLKAVAQLQPNVPDPNADVNALDITNGVDAFRGFAYPFSGPCACPSNVPCNSVPCTVGGDCVGFGPGSLCVRTCVGGSSAGLPCNNNKHCNFCIGGAFAGRPCLPGAMNNCPGGACSNDAVCPSGVGSGFCRDRCARCGP